MFHPLFQPLQLGICFLLPPLPHIHGPCLRLACQPKLANGQGYHVPTIEPFHRLDFLFSPTALWSRIPSSHRNDPLHCRLAEANSYRRPVNCNEDSDENSHVLVVRLLLLALPPVHSSQKNAILAGGFQDIVRRASHIQVGPICMPS